MHLSLPIRRLAIVSAGGALCFCFSGCHLASTPLAVDSTAVFAAEEQSQDPRPKEAPSSAPPVPSPAPESLPSPSEEVGGPGEALTLLQVEQIALEHHPRLVAASEAISAAEGRAWQAGRPPNPLVGASSPQWAGPQSQYNMFLSQDVLTGGKLRLDSAAAGVEVEQMQLAQVRAHFEVLTAVRKQFYAALALQSRLDTLRELQKITASSAKLGEDLLKAGEGARPDVLILEVEADKIEFAMANAETSLTAARRQLAIAAGAPSLAIGRLEGSLAPKFPQFDWLTVEDTLEQNSAELARANAEIRRTRILLDRAVVEPAPKLNVMGGYQRQVEPAQDQGLLQVTMSVPLWDRNRGGIQAARANHVQAHADFARLHLNLSEQATDALKRYRVASEQVEKYEREILPRTKESLQLTQKLYENGEADFLDLLAIQRTLQEANLLYLDSLEARLAAAADLAGLLQLEQFP